MSRLTVFYSREARAASAFIAMERFEICRGDSSKTSAANWATQIVLTSGTAFLMLEPTASIAFRQIT
jgi:hypothetical protein